MLSLLHCEYIKLKRSKFLLIGILGTLIVPFFVIVKAVTNYLSNPAAEISLFSLYDDAIMFLMLLFAPMVLTILSAWIISREYTDGTLKNIFVIPVSQTLFLCGKLLFFTIVTFMFMLVSWLEILVLALFCNCFIPVTQLTIPTFIFFFLKMLLGGILLCATQTSFIYLTIRTKGFVTPLIAIAVISLINVVLSNSGIAGFYPWSASYFLVIGRSSGLNCPKEISICIILIMCLLGIAASIFRFKKEEVK
ncbi:MAG: ABC transporter permease [Lachnospiraceae bacterium]|nr:ABC transporter permease [Lachnospiraceae bacterium]